MCSLFQIYRRKIEFCFFYHCADLRSAQVIKYSMGPWSYSFVGNCTTSLSSLCRRICRHWPSKILVRFILVSVSKIKSINSLNYISCNIWGCTVYPKKYAHGFCFAVLCCGYTLTDFPISIRLTSLALWQSNDCLSASKATLMNMDKYVMWIHYKRLHNHNKAKHNKTVCIFLGIYCMYLVHPYLLWWSENTCTLSYHHQIGSMTRLPLWRVSS